MLNKIVDDIVETIVLIREEVKAIAQEPMNQAEVTQALLNKMKPPTEG